MELVSNPELLKYIETAKIHSLPDEVIKANLINAGWSEEEVNRAFLTSAPDSDLLSPPVPNFGMWVAFQYIILFICLYISFTGLGGTLHHWVDQTFPDQLERTSYIYRFSSGDFFLKGYIASIIVAFPIFAVLFTILKKQALEKPAVKNLRARKILIYITLVGTFLLMVGHLIGTIYGFFGGNATFRSFAHLLVTFLVAGSVFGYLILEVKEDRKLKW